MVTNRARNAVKYTGDECGDEQGEEYSEVYW